MTKTGYRVLACAIAIGLGFFTGSRAHAAARFAESNPTYLDPPPTVLSMPDDAYGDPGTIVQVPISAAPADGIFGIDMTLSYDPSVIEAQNVTVAGIAATASFSLIRNLNTPGIIIISMFGSQDPLSGSGEIAHIQFHVIGAVGTTSPLTFTSARSNEGHIAVTLDNGLFTVPNVGALLSMPDTAQGGTGATVQVPISVTHGDGILGIDMTVTYDPAVILATNVTVSGIGATAGFAVIPNLGTPGVVGITTYATGDPLVGSGVILLITFNVVGSPGTTSALTFSSASINEGAIPATLDHGLFTVTCTGVANGTPCIDGNACTQTDTCQAGLCVGTNPVICPASVCHVAGTCNPSSGICSPATPVPDGTFCGDAGTECTNQDTCLTGVCHDNGFQSDTTACTDTDTTDCHAAECNGAGACDQNGGFESSGYSCGSQADTQCDNPNTCNATGTCLDNNESNGTSCGDAGTECTNQDTCLAGVCHDNGFQSDTTACTDTTLTDCLAAECNGAGVCDQSGGLESAGEACGSPADTQCDNPDTCNATGTCLSNNESDGTNCGDAGSECTNQDTCLAGACHDNGFQSDTTACTDTTLTDCHAAECNGAGACDQNGGFESAGSSCGSAADTQCDNPDTCNATGTCLSNNESNGTSCGDAGTECTNQDTCSSGVCQDNGFQSDTTACTDATPSDCLAAECNGAGACDQSGGLESAGEACGSPTDTQCDNPDTCNATGTCLDNNESNGMNCGDAGTECTNQDSCLSGVCHDNGFQSDTTACTDTTLTDCLAAECNGAGACDQSGGLESAGYACGSPADTQCDNPNTCNATGTCLENHESDGTNCGDAGTACTNQDTCSSGVCQDNGFASSGTSCNDSNACTQTDACNGSGACVGSNPVNCNDNNSCTDDSCNTLNGSCVNTPNDANSCTDGNMCTTDACSAGTCVHSTSGACGISGTVLYYRDDSSGGFEPSAKGVPNVGIDKTQDALADTTTGSSGTYSLSNLSGNVTVTTVNKFGSPRASDYNGAITGTDAAQIALSAVLLVTLSPNQRIAGDVTGNGTLSALDAAQVARFAVFLVDHFDVAIATGTDWKFLRCDAYAFPGDPGCGSAAYTFTPVSQPETGKNFHGILYGDVTGNWQPAMMLGFSAPPETLEQNRDAIAEVPAQLAALGGNAAAEVVRSAATPPAELSLNGWTGSLRAGERRKLTLDLRNADGILGLDLSLKFDKSLISIVDVRSTGIAAGYGVAHAGLGGTQRISAYGVLPLSGSGSVLTITIEAVRDTQRKLPIEVGGVANEGAIPLSSGGRKRGIVSAE